MSRPVPQNKQASFIEIGLLPQHARAEQMSVRDDPVACENDKSSRFPIEIANPTERSRRETLRIAPAGPPFAPSRPERLNC